MPLTFDEIWGLRGMLNLGLSFLGLFVLFALGSELVKLVARKPTDFVGVGAKFLVAAGAMAAIPVVSIALSQLVFWISGHLLKSGDLAAFRGALQAALGWQCDYDWYDVISMMVSVQGILLVFSSVVMFLARFIKLLIIDLAWPVVFAFEVYIGVITIPLHFLRSRDGLQPYLTRVLSVAIWPIVYAFIYVIIASAFPATIATVDGQRGTGLWKCDDAMATSTTADRAAEESGTLPLNAAGVPTFPPADEPGADVRGYPHSVTDEAKLEQEADRQWAMLHFLGIIFLYVLLTLKVPEISGRLLGVESPPGLLQMAGTAVRTAKGKFK